MRVAEFYKTTNDDKIHCELCPHNCLISVGRKGFCEVRENIGGKLIADSYGKITSMALDPIEKKPIFHFYPGKKILSIGSYGCNFRCGFCQNHEISMEKPNYRIVTPQEIAVLSKELADKDNIGVAYTYNEPFISFEFIKDCAIQIKEQEQNNIIVTNGYIKEEPLKQILPFIDAMNIDCKSFDPSFYKKISGELEQVKRIISLAAEYCHIEVTTLVIDGENDSEEEMDRLARWLSGISREIPLHISRFFPAYQYENHLPTPARTIYRLIDIAKQHLTYVHSGNC